MNRIKLGVTRRKGEAMFDKYRRVVDYLRISVTDRCNFRCRYCMPPQGKSLHDADESLTYEELLRIIRILGQHGVNKIRLTGGEPLVRRGIVEFIHNIRQINTIKDLAMTTNGSLLGKNRMAERLKQAGLDRVNISIDTVDSADFADITGRGNLDDVLLGLKSALLAGFKPVKINVVVTEKLSDHDIAYFIAQVYQYSVAIRFIEYMPLGPTPISPGKSILMVKQMIEQASSRMLQSEVVMYGNGPARYYRLPKAKGVFGFITPMSDHFCHKCNRLRLTDDGKLKPCLLSNQEVDIKAALRNGCTDQNIYEFCRQALQNKGLKHQLDYNTSEKFSVTRPMFQVGG
ncbi:MAG: molybdenum cofactor biosynthesis protein [Firmicutes bacterium]|nr:molybdenum cofactor biosynthesis protein [Bacillota bacterium]